MKMPRDEAEAIIQDSELCTFTFTDDLYVSETFAASIRSGILRQRE